MNHESRPSSKIEFTSAEPTELSKLGEWLRSEPGVEVRLEAALPAPGKLGAIDVLAVVASSSVLSTAIKTLPDFVRSRRSGLHFEATVHGKKIDVDAANVEEVALLLERLLNDE